MEVARVVHEVLDAFGLHAAVKTSGASGLHVVVPLPPATSYRSSLLLAQVVATEAAATAPRDATVVRKVSARQPGQVYVDYLQNVQGKSVASVLSLRARPAASVSMPIAWEELDGDLDPRDFTIDMPTPDAEARMQEWSAVLAHPVDLSVFLDAA
jgi:bifunctional non-homologous end joining protein LigD